ncbi:MAG: hypothetical protein JNM80_11350 [Phycisphaerae bacterium]|nr:hypothetical protein [Phycisphaerae bacterium]
MRFIPGSAGPTRHGHAGLLIGLLVVVVIVLVLLFGDFSSTGGTTSATGSPGGGSYAGQVAQTRKSGRETAFSINSQQLTTMIAQYKQEHNDKLPKSWADIEGLPKQSYTDAWGNELAFTIEAGPRGPGKVTYRSNGPDGQPNTSDDIVKVDSLPF